MTSAALALALLLAAVPGEDAPAPEPAPAVVEHPPADGEVLREILEATPTVELRALVRTDARFRALGAEERRELLRSIRAPWNPLASMGNVFPGFGVGSLFQGDWRGLWLTGADVAAYTLAVVGLARAMSGLMQNDDSRRGEGFFAAGAVLWVGGRVAGLILPTTWHGLRHAEVERGLREAPPVLAIAPALLPLREGAAPGAVVVVRF